MAGQYSQAHLDQAARQMGFPDYATYSAYQQKQAAMRAQNGIQGTGYSTAPQQPPAPAQPPQNWLQHLIQTYTPLGSAMKRVGDALGGR